jgi:hypothetical protein
VLALIIVAGDLLIWAATARFFQGRWQRLRQEGHADWETEHHNVIRGLATGAGFFWPVTWAITAWLVFMRWDAHLPRRRVRKLTMAEIAAIEKNLGIKQLDP